MSFSVVDALVLRLVDYRESDRILTLFSRERGKVEGRARGVRSSRHRFAGRMDLLTRVRVNLKEGRGAPQIEEAEVLEAFLGIRADLDRLAWAAALIELVGRIYGEGEAHPTAYDTLLTALRHLDKAEVVSAGLLHLFELRLLDEAGLCPHLGSCVSCGEPVDGGRRFVFHVARGGALCEACQGADGGLVVAPGTLRTLERGLGLPLERAGRLRFSADAAEECRRLVQAFLGYHVGGTFKARRFLESLEQGER